VPITVLLARTDDVALALEQVSAYPNGFTFNLAIMRSPFRRDDQSQHMHFWMRNAPRIGLEFADGSRVAGNHMSPLGEIAKDERGMPVEPYLRTAGGGGGGHHFAMRFWCYPLPPPGPITVYVEWSPVGIPETQTVINADPIREAAERAVVLWGASPPN
jgi:hypothetical protein